MRNLRKYFEKELSSVFFSNADEFLSDDKCDCFTRRLTIAQVLIQVILECRKVEIRSFPTGGESNQLANSESEKDNTDVLTAIFHDVQTFFASILHPV
jgi:hypothetical protein